MSGFENDVLVAANVNFDPSSPKPHLGIFTTDGQLAIGSTAAPYIRAGTLTSPDSSVTVGYSSPNITLQVAGGTSVGKTITGQSGGALSPTAGNWNVYGGTSAAGTTPVATSGSGSTLTTNVQISQAIASTDATKIGLSAFNSAQFSVDANGFVSSLGPSTDLHAARYIVSAGGAANGANYTTIGAALTAAAAAGGNQTIFIQPGTYTENLTLVAGINLTAFTCDGFSSNIPVTTTANVIINGKLTASYSGKCVISGIMLQTNSDNCIVVSGANTTTLDLVDCYINATNNTAISHTAANGRLNLINTNGNLGTTGITFFVQTAGALTFNYCHLINFGGSTTVSTTTSNTAFFFSDFGVGITSTNGTVTAEYSTFAGTFTTVTGGTCVFEFCKFSTTSNSSVSIGASTIVQLFDCEIISSNTNAITGAGTLQYSNILFAGTSSLINTTTQTAFYNNQGKYKASGQPCFGATLTNATSNVTGDGTVYTVIFNSVIFDQNSNYNNTTGVFTAPVAGRYSFSTTIDALGLSVAFTTLDLQLVTTGNTFTLAYFNPGTSFGGGNVLTAQGSLIVNMAAGDTAKIVLSVFGSTKTIGVANNINTYFSGMQVC